MASMSQAAMQGGAGKGAGKAGAGNGGNGGNGGNESNEGNEGNGANAQFEIFLGRCARSCISKSSHPSIHKRRSISCRCVLRPMGANDK